MRVLQFRDGNTVPVIKVTKRTYVTTSGEFRRKDIADLKASGDCTEYEKVTKR